MAKSKKRKRASKRPVFYETLPITMMPSVVLPEVGEELTASAAAVSKAWRRFAARLQAVSRPEIIAFLGRSQKLARRGLSWITARSLQAGLSTSNALIYAGQIARHSARYAGQAAFDYTPSIAGDFAAYIRTVGRVLANKRARLLYLTIGITGTIALGTVGVLTAANTIKSYAHDISSPAALLAKKKTGVTILDRNGQVLFEGYGAQAAAPVTLADVPQSLKDATLAAEDPNFYDHSGFSLRGTLRAAYVDITHGSRAEGGSTLTQQLVKNALLTSNKNFERKYQELLLSIELERHYSKDEIFDMYLNETYYGEGASGVEVASQTYFHKSAHDLTLGESALIAGLALGPSRLDPNVDLSAATGRRDYILGRMADFGKITRAQAKAAEAQPLQLASSGAPQTAPAGSNPTMVYAKTVNIQAPWFVFYVLDKLRAQYGDDIVEQGGMVVKTTLDLNKENEAEHDIQDHISALAEHHVTNGALISLEPSTGDILAMVGSVDYNAPGFGNVNVTLSERQPGSSFKPFAYATAFKKGWTGATVIDDSPLSVPTGDGTMYTPQNYDLHFHGKVTVRHALDNSLNIPAVKTLQFAGIHDTIQTAHDLGVTSLQDESRFGLALVLGGGEVSPLDMATAYGTFANNGTKVEPRAILKVTDRYGKDITKDQTPAPKPAVLDPRIAYMISSILSDDSARQPEFPANGPLTLSGRPVAAKTGTTNDFRDNWTVGYTPQVVTAVWVGNNDNTAMENVDGITGAAPIWHDYMQSALAGLPAVGFTAPAGVTTAKVCTDGGLANPWDVNATDEVFMSDAMPTKHCNTFPLPTVPATPTDPNAQTPPVTITEPFKFPRTPDTENF